MQQPGSDTSSRAEVLAARLRFVHLDTAPDGESAQRAALSETLTQGLASVAPDQREAMLAELVIRLTSPRESTPATPTTPAQGAVTGSGGDLEGLRRLGGALNVGDGQTVDPARALALAALACEFVAALDQFVWNTWQGMSGDDGAAPAMKRPAPLQQSMAKFAAASQGAPDPAQLKHDLEKLRQLTAALVAGVVNSGRAFAIKHAQKLAPTEIESMVGLARGLLVSGEAQCWRKYQELAGPMDAAVIEKELQSALVAYVQSLLKGIGR